MGRGTTNTRMVWLTEHSCLAAIKARIDLSLLIGAPPPVGYFPERQARLVFIGRGELTEVFGLSRYSLWFAHALAGSAAMASTFGRFTLAILTIAIASQRRFGLSFHVSNDSHFVERCNQGAFCFRIGKFPMSSNCCRRILIFSSGLRCFTRPLIFMLVFFSCLRKSSLFQTKKNVIPSEAAHDN